ncbi:MAG TPA: ATP-binding cassette domain-containing protein, partial [Candidatus Sumerlaeota bacterium]|nr:ATP-binding cassette domain-containing protein [Candidatus Sumerlaeota bacterium]
NPQHMALRDVDINVRPGQTIALVGESGAGKSTFASLLLGFYEPTQGAIRIDGRDLRDLNLRKLREQIGVVTQDNVMLNTSIRDNLLYGKLNATDEELERATRDAFAHDFIQAIPGGMDAIVGDRGVRLSGGQRQRLAIARALLKNPQVLILDEATSALDSESEAQIQKAMERLQADRTCIIIAHRLSTVMSADRILVFRDGAIVESGTHGELLEFGGEYARLCDRQFSPGNSPKPTEFP